MPRGGRAEGEGSPRGGRAGAGEPADSDSRSYAAGPRPAPLPLEPAAAGRRGPRPEPRSDPRQDPRAEPRQDPRLDLRQDSRPEPRQDPRLDPRWEPGADPRLDPRLDPRSQPEAPPQAQAAAGAATGAVRPTAARRLAAGCADLLVHGAVLVGVFFGCRWLGVQPALVDWPPLLLFALTFSFFYSVVPLAFWGHTLGMAWSGLVAHNRDGEPLTFDQTARRWLGGLLTLALAGLPLLTALRGGRTLSDLLSGSETYAGRGPV